MEIHYEYAIKRGDHRIIVLPIYNMEALEALLTRRSCKSYRPEMPSEEVLNRILEAGTFAPSGRGAQAAIIVAVTNKEVRDQLSQMNAEILGTKADPFYGAPVVLVALAIASWVIPTSSRRPKNRARTTIFATCDESPASAASFGALRSGLTPVCAEENARRPDEDAYGIVDGAARTRRPPQRGSLDSG